MTILQATATKSSQTEADVFPGELVDPGDLESDPVLWPDWCDERWTVGADPVEGPTAEDLANYHDWAAESDARAFLCPADASLTLAELVDRQAAFYRSWPLEAGEMIARAMDALAFQIRLTSATTPAEYAARVDSLEADARDQWESVGYDRAMDKCGERAACLGAFGHPA